MRRHTIALLIATLLTAGCALLGPGNTRDHEGPPRSWRLTIDVTPTDAELWIADDREDTKRLAVVREGEGRYQWKVAQSGFTLCAKRDGYLQQCQSVTLTSDQAVTFVLRPTVAPVPVPTPAPTDWCATKTEDQLRNIRADLGGVRVSFQTSPTRGRYLFTPTYPTFTEDQRAIIRREYKARGYTHFPIGPIWERGYPGWPGHDFRQQPEAWVALLEELWRDDLIPMVWLMPDGPYNTKVGEWGNDANPIDFARVDAELTPIYQREDFQRVTCVTVAGWEVTDNSWVKTIARAEALLAWQARVFPRAYRGWHAAVDNGASCNYDIDGEGCEGKAWRVKARYIHFQFWQTGAPGGWNLAAGRDPSNRQHRIDQFLDNLRYEVMRFHTDHYVAGGVRGADGKLLDVIYGEGSAYFELNDGESEDWGREWGRLAMTIPGVRGFGDGGR